MALIQCLQRTRARIGGSTIERGLAVSIYAGLLALWRRVSYVEPKGKGLFVV
jgi:hypothetical protein